MKQWKTKAEWGEASMQTNKLIEEWEWEWFMVHMREEHLSVDVSQMECGSETNSVIITFTITL